MLCDQSGNFPCQDVPEHAFALFEAEGIPVAWAEEAPGNLPLHAALMCCGSGRPDRSACAIAEQAGTDEDPGIIIQIEGCAAHLDADGEDVLCPACRQQGLRRAAVRYGGATTLSDQIECVHVGAQAQSLANVAREPRAQVARAGADENGVDVCRRQSGGGEGAFSGLGGEPGRVLRESGVQRRRCEDEGF